MLLNVFLAILISGITVIILQTFLEFFLFYCGKRISVCQTAQGCFHIRRTINVRLTEEELAARPMTPVTRDRYVPKSLKAYASMVSSADKGAVRLID